MGNIIRTDHFVARQQQRGISDEMVDSVLRYGVKFFINGARVLILVPRKKVKKLGLSEKITDVAVVIEDNALITVMHRISKIPRKKESQLHRRRRS